MKKKTIEKKKKQAKVRLRDIILQGLFYLAIAVLIIFAFATFDLGLLWDELKEGSNNNVAHISLILFRVLLYFLPGFFGFLIFKSIKKPNSRKKKVMLLVDCYNIQFFTFSLIVGLYDLAALDYRFNVDILDKMDSFIFLAGFIISAFIKKEIPEDQIELVEVNK